MGTNESQSAKASAKWLAALEIQASDERTYASRFSLETDWTVDGGQVSPLECMTRDFVRLLACAHASGQLIGNPTRKDLEFAFTDELESVWRDE